MNTPYLIQRLEKPYDYENPFAFGGGLQRGGIDKEAFQLIKKVMSFDYMGSAEFEWGAVPKALQVLNEALDLATFELKDSTETPIIWGICLPKDEEEVIKWVADASVGTHGRLKEHLGFKEALGKEKYTKAVGWLKIEENDYCDSPFMFFIDKQMYEDVLKLFNN